MILVSVLATEFVLATESLRIRGVAAVPALAVVLGRWWIAGLGVVAFALYLFGAGHPYLLELDALMFPDLGVVLPAEVFAVAIAFLPAAHRAIVRIPWRALLLWGVLALAAGSACRSALGDRLGCCCSCPRRPSVTSETCRSYPLPRPSRRSAARPWPSPSRWP